VLALLALAGTALLGACADPATAPGPVPAEGPSRLLVPYTSVAEVSGGGIHTCVRTTAGTVECWGDNRWGQTTVPTGLTGVTQVSAGNGHTCARTTAGTVACWGDNGSGQTTVPAGLTGVTQVTTGYLHSCALTTAGTVTCWGDNSFTVPAGLSNVKQVSAGSYHTCAVTNAGTVTCWGSGLWGQTRVPAGLSGVTQVTGGYLHTCALTSAGTVTCWGDNGSRQASVPAGLAGVVQVSAGYYHTCAVTGAGAPTCWGSNSDGQASVPAGLPHTTQVSSGAEHTCALTSLGALSCWGSNDQRQATVGAVYTPIIRVAPTGAFSVTPTAVVAGQPVTLALDGAQVPGYPAATQFTYAFDCGDGQGYGAFGAASTRTCPAPPVGPRTVRGVVKDQDGDTREYVAVVTVTDATPPVLTPAVTGTLGTNGWYRGDVVVAWAVSDAESGITALSGCGQTPVTTDTPGLTLPCSATSAGGTSTQSVTVKRDATPPTLSAAVTPSVVVQHGSATAAATASDATSGLAAPASCGPISTATAGARTVTCTAADQAGNVTSVQASYTVVSVALVVDVGGSVDRRSGVATVTGTATCSGAISVPVVVTLTQTVKSGRSTSVVTGTGRTTASCGAGGTAAWSAAVTGATGGTFGAGAASAVADVPGTSPAVQSSPTAVQLK
jgi:hypothetical protein